ncbi:MAG: SMC-Scp complex subunit ScpB [Fidelibacterota bacterium]
MTEQEIQNIVEALLFAASDPLTQQQVNLVFESEAPQLSDVVAQLNDRYRADNHAFFIEQVAHGYRLISRPEYDVWIRRLLKKSGRLVLTPAALETLAIIAYKQPLNRFEIESIRGVDCSGVLKTLLQRKLIQIKGRSNSPGRPLLYATTPQFLEYFGLNKLSDMPKLTDLKDLEASDPGENQIDAFK